MCSCEIKMKWTYSCCCTVTIPTAMHNQRTPTHKALCYLAAADQQMHVVCIRMHLQRIGQRVQLGHGNILQHNCTTLHQSVHILNRSIKMSHQCFDIVQESLSQVRCCHLADCASVLPHANLEVSRALTAASKNQHKLLLSVLSTPNCYCQSYQHRLLWSVVLTQAAAVSPLEIPLLDGCPVPSGC